MCCRSGGWLAVVVAGLLMAGPGRAQPMLVPLHPAVAGERIELAVTNLPAVVNPFDPAQIEVDVRFFTPAGSEVRVPAFWFQDYTRSLVNGAERVTAAGTPGWRVRFLSTTPGMLRAQLRVLTNGVPVPTEGELAIAVAAAPRSAPRGKVRVAAGARYFETEDGQPLRPIGANVCWPGARGTFDYDTWFSAMAGAGMNFARIWMAPWAFGIEAEPGTLTKYRLDRAWQLDQVFRLAEEKGIYLLLCLEYHGMFETQPDYWGANNNWVLNPYSVTNQGPATNQNHFFTSPTARAIYQKRLRYLVARFGYSQHLLGWEFFNEIDNVYRYLQPGDVAAWHALMGDWLRANDPFDHLVSTSLTGGSDRPEIWSLPQIDFTSYHSYNESSPAERLATVAAGFIQRYGKPVMIGEFGTDWRGWARENDPFLRGFRQGIWAGVMGGSVGSSMSWWWENLHTENVYPRFRAMAEVLGQTGWGRGDWRPIGFQTSGPPPVDVGQVAGSLPFQVTLTPGGQWGAKPLGQLAVPSSEAARYAPTTLNSFVHGTGHADLRIPFRLSLWATNNARLVMHLNSVSDAAILTVRIDGVEVFRRALPNRDGVYVVNNEYNEDIPVTVPAGKHVVEIRNAGGDWFYLDWVRLEQLLPATYPGGWSASPSAIGMRGDRESLLYVVSPAAAFPAGATNTVLPLQTNQWIRLTNWAPGAFVARWHEPSTGAVLATTRGETTNGLLSLQLPDYAEDLVGVLLHPPRLSALDAAPETGLRFRIESEPGGRFILERSANLPAWAGLGEVTNGSGAEVFNDPAGWGAGASFYRVRRP